MTLSDFMSPPGVYIEIGQSSLKMLDGEDGIELSLERLESGRLNPLCRERLISSLRVFLKKHRWRTRLRAFCAIGARGVSIRRLALPVSSREKARDLLLLQIEREFPLSPDQLAWGYRRIGDADLQGSGATPEQEYLVVAIKKEVLQEYSEMLAECGLRTVFTLGALARISLCPQPPASCAVLDIGRHHSELISFDNGVPSSIRILPWGGEDITHGIEEKLGISRAEAERLKVDRDEPVASNVDLDQKLQVAIGTVLRVISGSIPPEGIGGKLYLCGASARLREIAPQMARAIGGGINCERIEIAPDEGRSAAILGLKRSCEEGGGPLLILHPGKSSDAEGSANPTQWKWAAAAALLVLGSISLRYAEAVIQKPRLARKISEIKAVREKLPNIDRELSFLQYLKTNQPPYLEPIFVMAGAAPAGARIETLSMNRHGDLSMRAAMRDSQQVVEFRSKLIDSGLFSNVAVEEQTPTPDRQKILVRIIGQWKPSSEPGNLAGGVGRREVEKKPPEQEPGSAPIQNLRMVDRGIVSTSAPNADANK
jgi:Tfp pilus assembly PilM family ATPase